MTYNSNTYPPFLFFIGNSGSGKDTAMSMVENYFEKHGIDVLNLKRIITREADKDEEFISVTEKQFKDMRDDDLFAFYWKVYDTYYGYLEADIEHVINKDILTLFNISRSLTEVVQNKYPWSTFVYIKTSIAVSKSRVLSRSRGDYNQKKQRIERMRKDFDLPDDMIIIENSGTIKDLRKKIHTVCQKLVPEIM